MRIAPILFALFTLVAALQASLQDLVRSIEPDLVSLQDGELKPYQSEKFTEADYYVFYYSANWCPPCHVFAPGFVKFYQEQHGQADQPRFEVVFVSNDHSAEEMAQYMKEYSMPWPAIHYDKLYDHVALLEAAPLALPGLLIVDKEGYLVSSGMYQGSYAGADYALAVLKHTLAGGTKADRPEPVQGSTARLWLPILLAALLATTLRGVWRRIRA